MAEAEGSAPGRAPGDSVHERAKSASLVVAIVTILVGADPLDIRNSSHLFRKVDYIAIAFWILALLLFLAAQALSEGTRGGSLDYGEVALLAAVVAATLAGGLTIAAVTAKAVGKADDRDTVWLKVTARERAKFEAACGSDARLYGTVRTASFNDDFIAVKLTQLRHPHPKPPKGCDDVRVPRSEIVTVIEHPCDFDPPFKPEFCTSKS